MQRRLGLLGRVNLLATGEFESLQERHDFMQRELDDVRKARRDLLEVIAQIDREITETFTSAYPRRGRCEFERLVAELFPGGEGRLVLTDPADPLASGIEIEASPGRKRVRRISLLSGGERSLTAMAFLFAIFTARPSPFYLMDEVEPALDDVNLHRFLQLVEGFAARFAGADRHAPEAHDGDRRDALRHLAQHRRDDQGRRASGWNRRGRGRSLARAQREAPRRSRRSRRPTTSPSSTCRSRRALR